jgi:hypothetical protein
MLARFLHLVMTHVAAPELQDGRPACASSRCFTQLIQGAIMKPIRATLTGMAICGLTVSVVAQTSPQRAVAEPAATELTVTLTGCVQPSRVDPTVMALDVIKLPAVEATTGGAPPRTVGAEELPGKNDENDKNDKNNLKADAVGSNRKPGPVGAAAPAATDQGAVGPLSYLLYPGEGIDLKGYVGKKVEITGALQGPEVDPQRPVTPEAAELETNIKTNSSEVSTPESIRRVNVTAVKAVSGSCK